MSFRNYYEVLFLLVTFFLLFIGFLGPSFWKIAQLQINIKFFEKINRNVNFSIDGSNQFDINKNYLSSDQLENKNIVLGWSQLILNNIKNDIPIARMYFPYIPRNINQYETHKKKSIFIAILLPIALKGNELVLEERKLMKIAFSSNNIYQIELYSKKYRVKNFKKMKFSKLNRLELNNIKLELLTKINEIPISMILAQAIIESGWGSSRFAQQGNALFGEWTWKNNDGIKPQKNLDANHSVKNFESLSDSVNSYILNLNTHPAYKELRKYREKQFKIGKPVTGYNMANFLEKYAEIGFQYVIKVKDMIEKNRLNKFENSKLESF